MIDLEKEELIDLYLGWIEDYCNSAFNKEKLPAGVQLALDKLVNIDPLSFNLTSERIADLGKTYASTGDIPIFIYKWLAPYKRVRSI